MANAVLGKRSRGSIYSQRQPVVHALTDHPLTAAALSPSPRSRKRVHVLEDDEEPNPNGSVTHNNLTRDDESNAMRLDPSSLNPQQSICRIAPARPTKPFVSSVENGVSFGRGIEILTEQGATPRTPCRVDRISKQDPTTSRCRLVVGSKSLTPRTAVPPSSGPGNVYSEARKIFTRSANSGAIIGRDHERSEVQSFISARVRTRTGGCLYVSGPPGTGKSALISEVCRQFQDVDNVTYGAINCMSVRSAAEAMSLVARELATPGQVSEDGLRSVFLQKKGNALYLIVLDEIDSLLHFDPKILYNFFEWALSPRSRLVLIGIANALDLTDRFLPRLKARNLKPRFLPFLPYTAGEIASVLAARCRSLLPSTSSATSDYTPVLHPTAIQLISKKVASQSGDLRKALDLAQRVTDLVEAETRDRRAQQAPLEEDLDLIRSPLSENKNFSSPTRRPASFLSKRRCFPTPGDGSITQLTPEEAPRAALAHVVRVTSNTFGNGIQHRLRGLNFQQKAVLCSLVSLERKNRSMGDQSPPTSPGKDVQATTSKRKSHAAPTIRALAQAYAFLCSRDNHLHALSQTEFRDIVGTLEASSLVSSRNGKSGSLALPATARKRGKGPGFGSSTGDERRVSACCSTHDLEAAVDGVGSSVLKSIMCGDGLD